MKLFAIVYFAGKVAASIGPWPEGAFDACMEGRALMEQRARERAEDFTNWKFTCEWRSEAPALDAAKEGPK